MMMQPMAMQGQPGTQMMMTRPQIPTSNLQQQAAQANALHASHTTVENSQQAAQAGHPCVTNQTNLNVNPVTQVSSSQASATADSDTQPVPGADNPGVSNPATPSDAPPPYLPQWTKFNN